MLLPLEFPLSNDKLVFNLYDYDTLCDDIVCSMTFSLKDILKVDSSRKIKKAKNEKDKKNESKLKKKMT